ncbi:MAG TPA: NUDIX hydrolase [Candidatus Saccharimonadales bacterium]
MAPYEGYPSLENRLRLGTAGLRLAGETLIVPDGPWYVSGHMNRQDQTEDVLDLEVPTQKAKVDTDLSDVWQEAGLLLDQYGRPIHPYWRQLLADERIGLPTGVGFFWRLGPNATAAAVAYRRYREDDEPELLLIKRLKGGQWALPGGFVDRKKDKSAITTARRETGEETQLEDIGGTDEVILHKIPVGLRDTLHAWTENTVVLVRGDQDYLFDTEPSPGDDAVDVGWFQRDQIAQLDIFGAHAGYIELAYSRI